MKDSNGIAHIIHDALGHTLIAQNIRMQAAIKLWQLDPAKTKLFLEQTQQVAVEAIQKIRRSIRVFQADMREEHEMEMIKPRVNNSSQDMNVFPAEISSSPSSVSVFSCFLLFPQKQR